MAIDVRVTAENVNDLLDTGYTRIELYASSSLGGTFALTTTEDLVADTFYYTITHSGGSLNTWYKYRFTGIGGAAPVSGYSNPFRPEGATRLKIRQQALKDYGAGAILNASALGQAVDTAVFDTYKVATAAYHSGRGRGGWLYPTAGVNLGVATRITDSDPTGGEFTVSPSWSTSLIEGIEVEWHWFADPDTWNEAINRGLDRYTYLDSVPITGNGTPQIPLDFLPWLKTREQIYGLWDYESVDSDTGIPTGPRLAWGRATRWWTVRRDSGLFILETSPSIQTTETVYLDCVRPMEQMYTDEDVSLNELDLPLAAAFAYDEVLAWYLQPTSGASGVDRTGFEIARARHNQGRLRHLWNIRKPRPTYQRPMLLERGVAASPTRGR